MAGVEKLHTFCSCSEGSFACSGHEVFSVRLLCLETRSLAVHSAAVVRDELVCLPSNVLYRGNAFLPVEHESGSVLALISTHALPAFVPSCATQAHAPAAGPPLGV
eukprot:GHVT01070269.1.p1 GENE.GHVT01070269.1~~GHVT01070269.1.p1  ORF type:complete len:120 (+),score=10.68 GHVT01070269.1:45-362(+)